MSRSSDIEYITEHYPVLEYADKRIITVFMINLGLFSQPKVFLKDLTDDELFRIRQSIHLRREIRCLLNGENLFALI